MKISHATTTTTLNCCHSQRNVCNVHTEALNLRLQHFDLECVKNARRWKHVFCILFMVLLLLLVSVCGALLFSIVTVTESRSSSYCHIALSRVSWKGLFFGHIFLQLDFVSVSVSVVVSFVIILPSSKFIFVVPMSRRVSTRGCFNSMFFSVLSACSKTTIWFGTLFVQCFVFFFSFLKCDTKTRSTTACFVDIYNFYFRFDLNLITKTRLRLLLCTNCNEINTNFIFIAASHREKKNGSLFVLNQMFDCWWLHVYFDSISI